MRHFFASVSGESFHNDDGSDRQTIIASCRLGEPVILEAQPDNQEDENAIGVLRLDGKQIGYIDRGMAGSLVDDLTDFSAFVAGIGRGGGPGYLGVSLLVVVNDGQDETVVDAYARQVLEAEGNLGRSARQMTPHRRRQVGALRSAPSGGASALRWAFLAIAVAALGATTLWWVMQP